MAVIKIPKEEIEKYSKITPELLEKMNLMGIPIEAVHEKEIEIEVMPNRPDVLSTRGYLRCLKSYLGKKINLKGYKIKKSNEKIIIDKSVAEIRPYSMAAIVKGVNFTEEKIKEIMQWQEKIHATIGRNRKKVALGYYILDKIKFPVTYAAKDPKDIIFEPLGLPEKMNALQILSKHPCGKEFGSLLEPYKKFPVYYDSNNEVLSMPPIINSNNSGKITPGVADILIECSGNDLKTLKKVIQLALVDLIDEGGEAYSLDILYNDKKEAIDLEPEKMKISLEKTNKLLGLDLKEKDLEKLLPKMGYSYNKGIVEIPPWRADILHEVDIIEDIAISYGFNNLVPEIPQLATIGQESQESRANLKISEILAGLGLLEISTYHLIKEEESKLAKIENPIELLDSKTEYKILRPNLLIPLLRTLSENKDAEYPQKVFEIGSIFARDKENKTETGIIEKNSLIIAKIPGNFTDMKQIMDYLTKMLSLTYTLKEASAPECIEGRTAQISINSQPIGYLGEIHPQTLRNWNLKMPCSVIEISLEDIYNSMKE